MIAIMLVRRGNAPPRILPRSPWFVNLPPLVRRIGTARRLTALVALALASVASTAQASNPYLEAPPFAQVKTTPAYEHANLDGEAAIAELSHRGVPFVRVAEDTRGVRTPVRLTGPLHGVSVHSALPEKQRKDSPYEILDARLALALDDFCALLAEHDVVEVVHYTMYRPPPKSVDAPQFRHPGALAIDAAIFKKKDGTTLNVNSDWPSAVGAKTCGAGARVPGSAHGKELSAIVCEASRRRIFTYMLTPHFDAHHADHLHLEVKPGVRWFLVN